MTDTASPSTKADLAVAMAQLETRMAQMETRLVSQMASDYKSQVRYIQGLYAALIIGVAILVAARVFA